MTDIPVFILAGLSDFTFFMYIAVEVYITAHEELHKIDNAIDAGKYCASILSDRENRKNH